MAVSRAMVGLVAVVALALLVARNVVDAEGETTIGGDHPTEFEKAIVAEVTAINPTFGSVNGGQRLTISGYGFSTDFMNGANVVMIDDAVCEPTNFFGGGCTIDCTTADRIVCITTPKAITGDAQTFESSVVINSAVDIPSAFEYTYAADVAGSLLDIVPSSVKSGSSLNFLGEGWGDEKSFVKQAWVGEIFNSTPCAAKNLNYHPIDSTDPTNYVPRANDETILRPEDAMYDDQHFRCEVPASLQAGYYNVTDRKSVV